MKKPKRVEYHVVHTPRGWRVKRNGISYAGVFQAKSNAITTARASARHELCHARCSSLRIHNRDGTIAEERTYPRSSDPRRTKG